MNILLPTKLNANMESPMMTSFRTKSGSGFRIFSRKELNFIFMDIIVSTQSPAHRDSSNNYYIVYRAWWLLATEIPPLIEALRRYT